MPLVALVIPVLLAADLGAALPAGTLPDARDPIAPLLAASPAGERFAHEEDVQSAVPPGRWLAASGATLLGDAAVTGLALAGASMSVDAWLRDRPTTAGDAVTGVAVLAALVAPPVFATWGARRAGTRAAPTVSASSRTSAAPPRRGGSPRSRSATPPSSRALSSWRRSRSRSWR
jgi:hypothetical protein